MCTDFFQPQANTCSFLDLLNRPRNPRLIGSMEGTQENPITVAAADHAQKEPAVSLGTWVGRQTGH